MLGREHWRTTVLVFAGLCIWVVCHLAFVEASQLVKGRTPWEPRGQLVAPGGQAGDRFGLFSLAFHGDTALVGVPGREIDGVVGRGIVYVFTLEHGAWAPHQELMASDGQAHERFGSSVAIHGNVAAVSARGGLFSVRLPAVYVFGREDGVWTERQVLRPTAPEFGGGLALDAHTLVVGAPSRFLFHHPGSVFVYTQGDGAWSLQQVLTDSEGSFGSAVALDRDTIAIGAHRALSVDEVNQGAVSLYTLTGSTWIESQTVVASDGLAGAGFGRVVALNGDTLFVGAPNHDRNGPPFADNQGAVYVFTRTGVVWTEHQRLTAAALIPGANFGRSLVLGEGLAFVASLEAVSVYWRDGSTWLDLQTLPSDEGFHADVIAVDSDWALVGHGLADVGENDEQGLISLFAPLSDLRLWIDQPPAGLTASLPVSLAGWAADLGSTSGPGVDAVHVRASARTGETPRFLGAADYGLPRPDVAAFFGGQHLAPTGYAFEVTGLNSGTYDLEVMARSTLTGDFTRTETVTLTVIEGAPHPLMVLDQPQPGSTLHQPFDLGGWAIDRGAPVGPGVDTVHVWAFPSGPAAPTFLGEATYGRHRPGVGALFGSRFANSGFDLFSVNSLSPDAYTLTAFALSTVTGTFNNSQSVSVVIAAPVSAPDMVIDLPTAGSVTQPFRLAGWALDRGAQNGTGVSTIHVWAWPEGGGGPSFVGVASYGDARPDVAAFVGDPRFTEVGYDLTVSGLPPGTYDLTVYAFSTVTDDFNNARLVRVTVN